MVYALPNEYLNRFFYDTVFDFVNQKPQRLGDIYVGTKNKFAQYSADRNYRKFALLKWGNWKISMIFVIHLRPHYNVFMVFSLR